MKINQVTVKPTTNFAEVSSKRSQLGVTPPQITQRPSFPQLNGKSLSNRGIRCIKGIIAVGSTAVSMLCGIVVTEVWNKKTNKCTYNSSACHLIDLDSCLVVTLSILAVTTTYLAANQVKELCINRDHNKKTKSADVSLLNSTLSERKI